MKWIRRLMGTDFPDPAPGQVWRSRHSREAFVIKDVRLSDNGKCWWVDWHPEMTEALGRFINGGKDLPCPPPMCDTWYIRPGRWRRMLREEGRVLEGPRIDNSDLNALLAEAMKAARPGPPPSRIIRERDTK